MGHFFTLLGKQTNVIDDANLKGFYFVCIRVVLSPERQNVQSVIALQVHQKNCALKSFSEHYKVSGPVQELVHQP